MTAEQEKECQEHIDAIIEITTGAKLSSIIDNVRQQINLPGEVGNMVFGVVQKQVMDAMVESFARTGEQLKQAIDNPAMQEELRKKITELTTSKGETVVEIPE
jgi:hypothetical protein